MIHGGWEAPSTFWSDHSVSDPGSASAADRVQQATPSSGSRKARGMDASRRQRLSELSLRDFCLYRAICIELEDLQDTIQLEGLLGRDFLALSVAMRDRRLLVEWLRDLRFPPSSQYTDGGISEEAEEELLAHPLD
jgi:hypothetical protein